jgi:hypothetical protein
MTRSSSRITLSSDFPIHGLVAAIAMQAVRDARSGDRSAALWLATDGEFMLDCIGADRAAEHAARLGRDELKKINRKQTTGDKRNESI